MSNLAIARAEIKTALESIAEVGKVNDYRRWTISWEDIVNNFKEDDRINGWIIEMINAPAEWGQITNELIRTYNFRIWGVYSLKDSDASAKTFEDITEDVANTLSRQRTFSTKVYKVEPARIVNIDDQMFSSIFCHRCEIISPIQIRINLEA